jgi:Ni/Co efflux regulator RcnB
MEEYPMPRLVILAALASALAAPAAAAQQYTAEQLMKAWDKDRDGVLTKAEWLAAGRKEQGFNFADRDKNGKMTLEELRAGMARAKQMGR